MNSFYRLFSNAKITLMNRKMVPRVIKNYLFMSIGGKPLRTVEIAVTYKCQCNCEHCSAESLKDNSKKELSIDEIKKVMDESVKLGAIHFIFTGGEALIEREKLLELIRYADMKNCLSSIDSNGILLDEKTAKELKNAGLDAACISLDSTDKKNHDSFRKFQGCHDKSIKAIKNCTKKGIKVLISTVITKEGLKDKSLYKVLDYSKKLDSSVIFCLPIMTGKWSNNKEIRLNKKDYLLVDKLMKHPQARLCEENNYFFKGCAAGSQKIAISVYGEVMPC